MIKKTLGIITEITDLSKTTKEIVFKTPEPFDFIAGSFVNIFIDILGEKVRRAYSISSSDKKNQSFSISVKQKLDGKVSSIFWNKNMVGEKIEIMGPLGLNTADKMRKNKIYLFGFGIGAGVVKSLADHFSKTDTVTDLVIMTGSKFEDEIIYKEYFDELVKNNNKVRTSYIVSRPGESTCFPKGYIQDYISDFDFNNSDIYVCGQELACNELVAKIKSKEPTNCGFFIESFH
jgi:NAD(P)H-flavin reductase